MCKPTIEEINSLIAYAKTVRSLEDFARKNRPLLKHIREYTNFLPKRAVLRERLWYIEFGAKEPPKCKICDKSVRWESHIQNFQTYCSPKCAHNDDEIKEKTKQTNIERYGGTGFESKELADKGKQTNIERYGVEYSTQNEHIQKKIKQTNIERYGGTGFESKELADKGKQTNIERYGVDHPMKSEDIKEKTRQTNIERYGVEYPGQNEVIKEKMRQTNIERYGVNNVFSNKSIQENIKQTHIERYGVDHPMKSEDIQEKSKQTNIERYGGTGFEIFSIWKDTLINPKQLNDVRLTNIYKILCDKVLLKNEYEIYGVSGLVDKWGINHNALKVRLSNFGIIDRIEHRSYLESEMSYWLKDQDVQFKSNSRQIIPPLELDFYVMEYKLAIEMNGLYWHSDKKIKDSNYHLNKTKECQKNDIQLLHIFENEWCDLIKQSIFKSMILNKMNKIKVVYAQQCKIKILSSKEANNFLINNHIRGKCSSLIRLGLIYEDELVSVMIFGKSNDNRYKYELLRFCNKTYIDVVDSASKLFKHFLKENVGSIITYSDIRYSDDTLYSELNFNYSHSSKPNPHYFKPGEEKFKKDLTEHEDMCNNGYFRIFDCGDQIWTYTR